MTDNALTGILGIIKSTHYKTATTPATPTSMPATTVVAPIRSDIDAGARDAPFGLFTVPLSDTAPDTPVAPITFRQPPIYSQ